MQNTTRLLHRHETTMASRHVMVVEADDPALAELPAASLQLHSDHLVAAGPSGQHAMLPDPDDRRDLVIVILPKSGERLQFLLSALRGRLHRETEVWLVGPARGGIRGGVARLAEQARNVEPVDSARHCKLYRGFLAPSSGFDPASFACRWQWDGMTLISYPGVFSHGRVDEGTARLLAAPTAVSGRPVLDMACGCGVVAATLARQGALVTAVDVSATAVTATRETLAANGLAADVQASDLFSRVRGRFDAIWTNPPFHEGTRRTLGITDSLIRQAPEHLSRDGCLVLVANRGLPYEDALRERFSRLDTLSADNRYIVYRACRRG